MGQHDGTHQTTTSGNHMGRFHLRQPHTDHPLSSRIEWQEFSKKSSSIRDCGLKSHNWQLPLSVARSALHLQISRRHLKPILTIELSASQTDSAHFSRHSIKHTYVYTQIYIYFDQGYSSFGGGISSTVLCRFNCNICHCGLCIYQFQNSRQMATAMNPFHSTPEPKTQTQTPWKMKYIFLFLLYSPAKTVTTHTRR